MLWHRRALAREPSHSQGLGNLGSQVLALNELAAAEAWFQRAVAAGDTVGEARWNRGIARLLAGDLVRGFADYECRWNLRAFSQWRRSFPAPPWQGEPALGRTILVHAEQGLGDTIQFVRYLKPLAAAGWRIVLECQGSLVRLFASLPWPCSIVARGDALPAFEREVPLLSLAHRFGTALADVPAPIPYLGAPAGPKAPAGSGGGRRIGVVWAGNPEHRNDANRSLDAEALDQLVAGLARLRGIAIHSLQVGPRAQDLVRLRARGLDITDAAAGFADFADTAAAVAGLDLVIGVDTAVMHLVGALGRPGALLLGFAPDWRWLLGLSETPWYPSLRLHRQPAPGNWREPIDEVLVMLERTP
jgi:hypothetical protein